MPSPPSEVANVNSRGRKRGTAPPPGGGGARETPKQTVFRIGRSIAHPGSQAQPGTGNVEEPERPVHLITHDENVDYAGSGGVGSANVTPPSRASSGVVEGSMGGEGIDGRDHVQ